MLIGSFYLSLAPCTNIPSPKRFMIIEGDRLHRSESQHLYSDNIVVQEEKDLVIFTYENSVQNERME